MQSPVRWLLFASLFTASVTTPAWAAAVAAAEALFDKGLTAMEAGRYAEACSLLEESYRLDPLPGALFTLAECHAKAGKVASAVARYKDSLRLFSHLPPEQQKTQHGREEFASSRMKELSPLMPELTLVLPATAPAGVRIWRDGAELSAASLGVALPLDPGDHIVSVEVPGEARAEQRVTLAPGEKKRIELTVGHASSSGRWVGGFVAGGFGVGGVVVGAVLGGLALGKKGMIDAHCRDIDGGRARCDAQGLNASASGKDLALWSTVSFGVGLAGLAASAVLLFATPSAQTKAGAKHRFIPALTGVGSAGVTLGVRGVW
jgi:hypothetical protein